MGLYHTIVNWKIKALCYIFSNLIMLLEFKYYQDLEIGRPFIGILVFLNILSILFIYEQEQNFLEIYALTKKNNDDRKKWLSILDKMPFFILCYKNVMKNKITYMN
jgi:hypothetical protein